MQEMLSSVLLAALASPLLAGALASENREHIHGAQRSHPRHRLPGLSGKSVMDNLLQQDAGSQLRVATALEPLL